MPIISFGTQVIKSLAANGVKPSKLSIGNTLLWQNMVPMGMNKNGSFVGTRNTFSKITSWLTRSGYPDTVISSDGLQITNAGNVNIFSSVVWGDVSSANQFRILLNGVVLATGTAGGASTIDVNITNVAVAVGDSITAETYSTGIGSAVRTVLAGTYVYFEAA